MSKKIVIIACLIVAIGSLAAYAMFKTPEPPAEVIQEGALQAINPRMHPTAIVEALGRSGIVIDHFEVVNKYPREINGEKVMVYETMSVGKNLDPKNPDLHTFGVVKRGDSWYFIW